MFMFMSMSVSIFTFMFDPPNRQGQRYRHWVWHCHGHLHTLTRILTMTLTLILALNTDTDTYIGTYTDMPTTVDEATVSIVVWNIASMKGLFALKTVYLNDEWHCRFSMFNLKRLFDNIASNVGWLDHDRFVELCHLCNQKLASLPSISWRILRLSYDEVKQPCICLCCQTAKIKTWSVTSLTGKPSSIVGVDAHPRDTNRCPPRHLDQLETVQREAAGPREGPDFTVLAKRLWPFVAVGRKKIIVTVTKWIYPTVACR